MGSPSARRAVSPPAGSPADKRTLSRLNDKQFCDAEAVKCIRQVQGSLPNWCVRVSAIRGQVNSLGDCRGKADNGPGGSGRAGGPGGARRSAPLARLSHCTQAPAPSSHQTGAAPLPGSSEEPRNTGTPSEPATQLEKPHCPNRTTEFGKYL